MATGSTERIMGVGVSEERKQKEEKPCIYETAE